MKKLRLKLDSVLDKKGISQLELKKMIDEKHFNGENKFRTATISEMYNNQRKTINREHIQLVFDTLELDHISELIEMTE